jgi:TP901 family phage tail tape measure protein
MEEKDYIIKYIVDIGDGIQKMKQLEAQANKTASNLQKSILGPTGIPASQYVAANTPGFARTAEQRVSMGSSQIIMPSGYIAGGQKSQPYNYRQQIVSQNYQEMARSSIASAYNLGTIINKNQQNATPQNEALDTTKAKFENLSKSIDGTSVNYQKLAIRAMAVIPIWMALRAAMMGLIQGIQNGAKFIVEFESAMSQIKVVGKGTEEEYKRLGDTVLAFSSTYGVAATEALKASQIFAQQGLTINEVINMTRTSMIASVVLGKDVTSVAEDLTAAVRAYNIPMEESLTIVDKWMKVQKNFAVTATDLAEATKKAGATASSFGISYDKFLGDITAIIEVTRKSGSEAGNALQMMYTRLFTTGAKAVQEIAKIPIYQDAAGKATMQNTNIFRNAGDVIDDVAASWNKLSESEKIELATQIGSRRQATPFIALMNNYSRGIEAQVDSITSAGDALKSFNILQDTTKVKIVQMQNTWSTLSKSIGDTSTFKFAIDSVKNLAEGLIFLANATDYAALKMRQKKQIEIDATSADISRLDAIKKLTELETKIGNNPSEKNKLLLSKIKTTREDILAANPELASMDVKSLQYKNIAREVERDRATEIQQLRAAEILEVNGPSPFILKGLSQNNAKNALIKKYGSVAAAGKAIMGGIDKEIRARMATQDVTSLLGEADETKIENKQDVDLRKHKEISEEVQHRAEIMTSLGASEQQILQWQIQQYEINGALERSVDAQNEKRKLTYKLEQSITNEIKKQSDVLQSSVEGSLKDLILGKTNLSGMFTKIGDTMRDQTAGALAGGLTDRLFDSTGIGNVFGTQMNNIRNLISGKGAMVTPIENAHYDGIKRAVPLIISAHQQGSSGNRSGVGGTGGAANASWSGSSNIGGVNTSGLFGGSWWQAPVGQGRAEIRGGATQAITAPANYYKNQGNTYLTRAQALMGGTQSALTGYSAYQSASAGGVGVGGSVASGLLSAGGSMAGIMAGIAGTAASGTATLGSATGIGLTLGPVGWAMLGVGLVIASMIPSLFSKGSESTSSQTSSSVVSSKINVTNKNLEIINRNLVALRTDIKTYILPNSSYFSAKTSLDEEFSISSRMASIK